MSQALTGSDETDENALKVGMIAEMIHTASLIHDDVIDKSDTRLVTFLTWTRTYKCSS